MPHLESMYTIIELIQCILFKIDSSDEFVSQLLWQSTQKLRHSDVYDASRHDVMNIIVLRRPDRSSLTEFITMESSYAMFMPENRCNYDLLFYST